MTPKNHKNPSAAVEKLPEIPPPRWVPPGVEFYSFPRQIQTDIVQIVNPIYEQLVLKTDDSLEISTGLTIVHLLWMEILNQYHLGQEYNSDNFLRQMGEFPETFARQLQLVDAKAKTSFILVRLREIRRHHLPPPPPFPAPIHDSIALPPPHVLEAMQKQ